MTFEFLVGMVIILTIFGVATAIADRWEWIDNIFPEDDYRE
jgi:hypothetical protein